MISDTTALKVLFWSAIGTIIYTYGGFPILLAVRALVNRRQAVVGDDMPLVSMIVAAYNEANGITRKLENVLALDYPVSQLELIVVSDGSDDGTDELVRRFNAPNLRLLSLPRQGKNLALNAAVAIARGEILVFSDADSMLEPDALRRLISPFADAEVGAVAGDYRHTRLSATSESTGEQMYWSFDRIMKELQSRGGSVTSASGQIFAIRASLCPVLPVGVTDDFYISIQAPAKHKRLIFEPRAIARGPVAPSHAEEFRRKVRVMTAGLRGVWHVRRLLNPLEYGFFAVQLFSHKVLRRLTVLPLMILVVTSVILRRQSWFFRLVMRIQMVAHG